MTAQLMISQLRLGKTGAEILSILNAIVGGEQEQESVMTYNTPTMDEIEF
jgi:hypothetical protein